MASAVLEINRNEDGESSALTKKSPLIQVELEKASQIFIDILKQTINLQLDFKCPYIHHANNPSCWSPAGFH